MKSTLLCRSGYPAGAAEADPVPGVEHLLRRAPARGAGDPDGADGAAQQVGVGHQHRRQDAGGQVHRRPGLQVLGECMGWGWGGGGGGGDGR